MKKTISIFVLLAMLVSCLATFSVAADAPDTTVALQGYQKSAIYFVNDAPVYDIRIVATGTDETAKNVGFTVTAEDFDKEWDKNTTTVYESLSATDSKGNTYEAINAEDKEAAYVYAMVIKGVPADVDVNFSVTPYKTDAEGKKEGETASTKAALRVIVLNEETSIGSDSADNSGDGENLFNNGVWAIGTAESNRIRFKTTNPNITTNIVAARVLYSATEENGLMFHYGPINGGYLEGLKNTNGQYELSDAVKINLNMFLRMNSNYTSQGTTVKADAGTVSIKAIYFYVNEADCQIEGSNAYVFGTHLTHASMQQGEDFITLTSSDTTPTVQKKNSYAMGCGEFIRVLLEITDETDTNGVLCLHDGGYEGQVNGLGNTEGYQLSNTIDLFSLMNNRGGFLQKARGYENGWFSLYYRGDGTCKIKAIYFFDTAEEADAFELPTA